MSFYDFTKLYGTTQKAKFWCDYMTGLRGELEARETSRPLQPASVWSRVSSNEVLLYDVLYGEYFRAPGESQSQCAPHTSRLSRERDRDDQLLPCRLGPRPCPGSPAIQHRPHQDIRHQVQDGQDVIGSNYNITVNTVLLL